MNLFIFRETKQEDLNANKILRNETLNQKSDLKTYWCILYKNTPISYSLVSLKMSISQTFAYYQWSLCCNTYLTFCIEENVFQLATVISCFLYSTKDAAFLLTKLNSKIRRNEAAWKSIILFCFSKQHPKFWLTFSNYGQKSFDYQFNAT